MKYKTCEECERRIEDIECIATRTKEGKFEYHHKKCYKEKNGGR